MNRKTIRVDAEAYRRLARAKRDGESFSRVIKRVVPAPFDVDAWLRSLAADPFGDEFCDAVERGVVDRRNRTR